MTTHHNPWITAAKTELSLYQQLLIIPIFYHIISEKRLKGLLSRYCCCKKITTVSFKFFLSWAGPLALARKLFNYHTNIYIWWFKLNFFEETSIWLGCFAVSTSSITSFLIKRFMKALIILKPSAYKNAPIGALVWNLWKNTSRTAATELKNAILAGINSSLQTSFTVLTVNVAGSFLAIEIYFFTLENTTNALWQTSTWNPWNWAELL